MFRVPFADVLVFKKIKESFTLMTGIRQSVAQNPNIATRTYANSWGPTTTAPSASSIWKDEESALPTFTCV